MAPVLSTRLRQAAVLVCGAAVAGCGSDASSDPGVATPGVPASITVTSASFGDGGAIPMRFTCDGGETSPQLAWSGGAGAKPAAWALVVDDQDSPGGTFVHWVVLDIPAGTRSVPAGAVPEGGSQAVGSSGSTGYAGPCPPSGTHHYRFTVYALSAPTGLDDGAGSADALAKIRAAADARGTLVGTYTRGS